jgi:hypothetical protein
MRRAIVFLAFLLVFSSPLFLPAEQAARMIFSRPSAVDNDSVSFRSTTGAGILIPTGEFIEFVVPQRFADRCPNYAIIRHRKDRVFLREDESGLDKDSPWLSVSFHNPEDDAWYVWSDQFGAKKRSAVSSSGRPKQNTLYNFPE